MYELLAQNGWRDPIQGDVLHYPSWNARYRAPDWLVVSNSEINARSRYPSALVVPLIPVSATPWSTDDWNESGHTVLALAPGEHVVVYHEALQSFDASWNWLEACPRCWHDLEFNSYWLIPQTAGPAGGLCANCDAAPIDFPQPVGRVDGDTLATILGGLAEYLQLDSVGAVNRR